MKRFLHHVPFLVPRISTPVTVSTHQQYPVDPWHCFFLKEPSCSHLGTNAPGGGCLLPKPRLRTLTWHGPKNDYTI